VKKKLSIVLAVVLTLSLLLTSLTFAGGGKKEVELAQEAGQAWLDNTVELIGEPLEWIGASLTTPQVCYDLKGKPNAYMFTIENAGEVVGYIIVGSLDYGYPVFEAADVPPPSIPSADKCKSILERDLGLKVGKFGKPARVLYLGFDNLFAVYEAGQQEVAVNLKFDSAIPASNLKTAMPSPEDYKAAKKTTGEANPELSGGGDYNLLSRPSAGANYLQSMSYYTEGQKYWCGPCSGTSIGRYYRDRNPIVYGNNYNLLPDDDEDMYDYLYDSMEADICEFFLPWGCVSPFTYGDGFIEMTEDPDNGGYDNFIYIEDWLPSHDDYWNIVDAIDSGWPTAVCAVLFNDELGGDPQGGSDWPPDVPHWVAIKGYYYPYYSGGEYSIICTDSYCKANWLYLDWDNLTYVPPPFLYTCTIRDDVVENFEWGDDGVSLEDWEDYGGDVEWDVFGMLGSFAEIDESKQHLGEKSAEIHKGYMTVYASYAKFHPDYIGCYLMKEDTSSPNIMNGDANTRVCVRITPAGVIQYLDDAGWQNTESSIDSGEWYLIELRHIDWLDDTYDIYVNNHLVESGVPMHTYSGFNGRIAFGDWTGSDSFWIDDILD